MNALRHLVLGFGILALTSGRAEADPATVKPETVAVEKGLKRCNEGPVNLRGVGESHADPASSNVRVTSTTGPVPEGLEHLHDITAAHSPVETHAGVERAVVPSTRPDESAAARPIRAMSADNVVGLRASFRACYVKDPKAYGKLAAVIVTTAISASGVVESGDVTSSSELAPGVRECIAQAVRKAKFRGHRGGGAFHVVFVPQG